MASLAALSKCRLCLKLGDFYSIFAADNSVQLAMMAMACSDVKIYEGDGLPDKVCGECVEKLSAAYIFKQQCERSDVELRKALNTSHTNDSFSGRKSTELINSQRVEKSTPLRKSQRESAGKRNYKEIDDSNDPLHLSYPQPSDLLEERYSVFVPNTLSLEGTQLGNGPNIKKRRLSDSSNSTQPATTQKEPYECKICNKTFTNYRSNNAHQRVHKAEALEGEYEPSSAAQTSNADHLSQEEDDEEEDDNYNDEDYSNNSASHEKEKFRCPWCGRQNTNKTLFLDHVKQCNYDGNSSDIIEKAIQELSCPICLKRYKKKLYLRKHLGRSACGVAFKHYIQRTSTQKVDAGRLNIKDIADEIDNILSKVQHAQCSNCEMQFRSYVAMLKHFLKCLDTRGVVNIRCMSCSIDFTNKKSFSKHIKMTHILANHPPIPIKEERTKEKDTTLKCHKCNKVFENQTKLVMHLAAHMANIDDNSKVTIKRVSLPFKCVKCNKKFRYRASLRNHLKIHMNYPYSGNSDDEGNPHKCDLCYKGFKYPKSLLMHKRTEHLTIQGPTEDAPRRGVQFSKCPVKCLHCNVMLGNKYDVKMHNKMHIDNNTKVKNEYTCLGCDLKFTNTKIFRNHIKEHNCDEEVDNDDTVYDASISNFCEVTSDVTKDFENELEIKPVIEEEQPIVTLSGFNCTICNEKLASLKQYHQHMSKHVKINKSEKLSCFVCHSRFNTEIAYRKHMKIHYYDKNINPALLICKLCKRPSKNMRSYIAHMSWHSALGRYRCYICQETFAYYKYYVNHMSQTHTISVVDLPEGSNFKCDICQKFFNSNKSLKYHVICHQQGEDFQGEKVENVKCTMCDKEFLTKYRQVMHLQSHHNVTIGVENAGFSNQMARYPKTKIKKSIKIPCPVCDLMFMTRPGLNKHLRKCHPVNKMVKRNDPDEKDTKPHVCILCMKEFSTEESLKFHLAAHNRKPTLFKCSLCFKKTFSLKMHEIHLMRAHLLQHQKEPLDCDHCDEKFSRRQELRMHLQNEHDITENYCSKLDSSDTTKNFKPGELKDLQCHICGKVLRSAKSYQRHLLWHNTRRCNYCFMYFNKKTFLAAHVMYNCSKKKLLGNSDPFDKKLKCYICMKTFSIVIKLNCHLKTQHNVDPVSIGIVNKASACDFCFSVFESEERMLSHRKCHFPGGNLYCKICSKCIRPIYFKKHRYTHYGENYEDNPIQCEHCPEKFVSVRPYTSHLKHFHNQPMVWYVPRESPSEKCTICHKEFTNISRHMMHHEKYKCKKCSQYFLSEILYNEHFCEIESEDESSPLARIKEEINISDHSIPADSDAYEECDFCFKAFSNLYSKSKHHNNHANILFFGCRLCNKRFSMKSAFNVHSVSHRLQHFKKNPLQCRHCGDTFTRLHLYTAHLRTVHDDPETLEYYPKFPPEECVICKKTFPNIHRHYKYHQSLRCKQCLKYILSERLYSNHVCDDPNEDQSLLVEYNEDITHRINPEFADYEIEKAAGPVYKDVSFEQFQFYKNNSIIDQDENPDNINSTADSFTENEESILPHDVSSVSTSSNLNNMLPPHLQHLTFTSFSPVISSTVSLSSSNTEREKEGNSEMVDIEIKSEPIDQHYYKDYNQYDFQSPLLNMHNRMG